MSRINIYSQISNAVAGKLLKEPFSVSDVNRILNNLLIRSSAFLAKHAAGNPGDYSEMFTRVDKGRYKLNPDFKRFKGSY